MVKREDYNEIIETSVNRARSSLKHFLMLLNLDPELFKHLVIIDVKLDEEVSKVNAKFNSKECRYISLYSNYIDGLLSGLEKEEYSKQYVINDIATTIIHETIHANRSVYIKDASMSYEVIDYKEYDEEPVNVDEDYLNYLLSSVMCDEEYFSSYVVVPIKVDYHGEDKYTVYAYNTVTNQYLIYENQVFRNSNIHEIAEELNTNRLRYTVNKTISCTQKFENLVYTENDEEELDLPIDDSLFLEDCLVEMLARFILYSRKANKFNLDAFVESVDTDDVLPEYRLAAKMLKKLGMGVIMWFMLSYYDDFFDGKLYDIYKEKYDEVMEEFMNLASHDEQIMVDEMVVSVTNILENTLY